MKKLLGTAAMMLIGGYAYAGPSVSGDILPLSVIPSTTTIDFDMRGLDRFSLQAVYSTGTMVADSVTDGGKSAASITVAAFTGGVSSTSFVGHGVTINNIPVTFTPVATATGTAQALSDAIMANSSLNTIIVSTWTSAVVYATSTVAGANAYALSTSSRPLLTPSGFQFAGGGDSAVSVADDSITQASHGFPTGLKVLFATVSGTAPTGLTTGTTYYTIKANDSSYKLASSEANAIAGTAVDITALTGSGSFTVTPLTFTQGVGSSFKWQASNDGTNFSDLSISSVTVTTTPGNTLWDFGAFNYRKLRMRILGPQAGGLSLQVLINGQQVGPE